MGALPGSWGRGGGVRVLSWSTMRRAAAPQAPAGAPTTAQYERTGMLNHLRPQIARVTEPVGRGLARTGITPNTITVVGTCGVAVGALGFYTRGELLWGTVIITVSVLLDLLDGALARVTGTTGAWGAFLDSTLDRVADALIFGTLVWWLAGDGHQPVLAGVALFCLVAGAVVSYAKARAEGLGLTCNVGIAERGERMLLALVSAGVAGLGVPYILAVGLWVLAVLSAVTVGQRVAEVRRQIPDSRPGATPPAAGRSRPGRRGDRAARGRRA